MRMGCRAVLAVSAIVALPACYAPTVHSGAPCDLSSDNCPTGETCQAGNGGAFCVADNGHLGDAGGVSRPDAPPGAFCIGNKLLGGVCLAAAPTAAVTLAAGATINTSVTTAGNCSELQAQPGGGSVCIIAGTTITLASGGTVRAIGGNPIVLVAAQTISIAGTLDASSHAGETVGGAPVLGAGARSATDCNAIGTDGTIGQNDNGGSGAAGGSFGTAGGAGGNGKNGTTHGVPAAAQSPTRLVGGCPGGKGGDGAGTGGGSAGGAGGGAVYLSARQALSVTGKIIASGAGGLGGTDGMFSSGGGGGGGSGGMIGLEAPQITVSGSIFANGGGGGGGGGSQPTDNGKPGADPIAATTAASGGGGGGGGGGAGGAGSTTAAAT
ncbi:MAG TPA: hypothetical protein VFP84_31655, partial [Kofleriaceae bacterium]|nr:hypothetical protein [Kofleriaceae bacterium]